MRTRNNVVSWLKYGAAPLMLLVMWPGLAFAVTVQVDCTGQNPDPSVFPNLQAAINSLDPAARRNVISVSGTCMQPPRVDESGNVIGYGSFSVLGFVDLSINGSATLSQPVAVCGQPNILSPVLSIQDSRVFLSNLLITGGRGLDIQDSFVFSRGGNQITNSAGNGITVGGGSQLTLNGVSDEVANSCSAGINAGLGSSVPTSAHIHGNGGHGLFAGTGGSVLATGIVEANARGGLFALAGGTVRVSGPALIQNNGNNLDPTDPFYPFRSGVGGRAGAIVFILGPGDGSPGPTIQNNTGPGVLADLNTSVVLRGNLSVQSNPDGGVTLRHQSVADLDSSIGAVTLVNNGGGQIGDLNCDPSSQVFGDVSGVGSNKCGPAK